MNERAAAAPACGVDAGGKPLFVPGARWTIAGKLTVDSAAGVFAASQDAALPEIAVVICFVSHNLIPIRFRSDPYPFDRP